MLKVISTLAILAAFGLPAVGQGNTPPSEKAIITSVTVEDIQAFVVSEGYTLSEAGAFGPLSVRATTPEGLIFDIIGTACETEYGEGCLGMLMQVGYFADDDVTYERINNANLMWQATSTWYDPTEDEEGPTLGITRYVILDRGVTLDNIRENLVNMLAIAPQVADYIWQVGAYAPEMDVSDNQGW
ncbi:YbjN domain-containing protein [Hyphomonas sp.]|uniref:YbjN domain-containing protein n=1 Tax=Hyphomonas sp. TaxID=87 RepID=UPI00391BE5AE